MDFVFVAWEVLTRSTSYILLKYQIGKFVFFEYFSTLRVKMTFSKTITCTYCKIKFDMKLSYSLRPKMIVRVPNFGEIKAR